LKKEFAPLCNYTHYSLQLGFSKPKALVKKCKDNGYTACGISDYKSISGTVRFFQECKKAGIKPIIGCSFDGFSLFSKNKDGWFDLIAIVSAIQHQDEMTVIKEYCKRGNLIYVGRKQQTPLCPGGDNYLKGGKIKNYFYTDKSEVDIHRISLCSGLKVPLPDMMKYIGKGKVQDELKPYIKFFTEDSFGVPNKDHAVVCEDICSIVDSCTEYDILEKPMLPTFPTPNGESEEEYLKQLCRQGWNELLGKTGKVEKEEAKQRYLDQFNEEFGVIKGAKLFGYFLIVWDIINFIKSKGWISGPGRGCFLPDTRVRMSNGLLKPISIIKKGESVVDAFGGSQIVADTLSYLVDEEIIEMTMENGKIIRCTEDHKFLTSNRGWVTAKDLTEFDEITEI